MTRRRSNGEGHVRQRPGGLWEKRETIGIKADGSPKTKSFYGRTQVEAKAKATAYMRDLARGLPTGHEKITVGEMLTKYLTESAPLKLRASTLRGYRDVARLHLIPAVGHVRAKQLTAQQFEAYMAAKLKEGCAEGYVRLHRATLSGACEFGIRNGWLYQNVAKQVPAPRTKRKVSRMLSIEEARAFLAIVKGTRWEALYTVAIALGLRRGEVLGLMWADIDLDKRLLSVTGSVGRTDHKLQRDEPKTHESRRTLRLPAELVPVLHRHRVRQVEEQLKSGPRWKDMGYVFPSTVGTPLEPRNLNRHFSNTLSKMNIPKARLHDLRHTAGSFFLVKGVPMHVVKEILGHTTIATTINIYGHVLPSSHDHAADSMNSLLWGTE